MFANHAVHQVTEYLQSRICNSLKPVWVASAEVSYSEFVGYFTVYCFVVSWRVSRGDATEMIGNLELLFAWLDFRIVLLASVIWGGSR